MEICWVVRWFNPAQNSSEESQVPYHSLLVIDFGLYFNGIVHICNGRHYSRIYHVLCGHIYFNDQYHGERLRCRNPERWQCEFLDARSSCDLRNRGTYRPRDNLYLWTEQLLDCGNLDRSHGAFLLQIGKSVSGQQKLQITHQPDILWIRKLRIIISDEANEKKIHRIKFIGVVMCHILDLHRHWARLWKLDILLCSLRKCRFQRGGSEVQLDILDCNDCFQNHIFLLAFQIDEEDSYSRILLDGIRHFKCILRFFQPAWHCLYGQFDHLRNVFFSDVSFAFVNSFGLQPWNIFGTDDEHCFVECTGRGNIGFVFRTFHGMVQS